MNSFKKMFLVLSIVIPSTLHAGVYTDDLSKCLVDSSTSEDKITLAKWMFTAMTLHPAVASMSTVTSKQRDDANKGMGELMVDLISVRCLEQSKKAIKNEGQSALEASFNVLGQVAGKELLANPNVALGLAGLKANIDSNLLNKRLGITP